MIICFFNFIEVVYVKIGNSAFYLTLNLTGVHFQRVHFLVTALW